jgi:hypothetical protein
MAFISQIVSVIDNQDGTFTTQVMVFQPDRPVSVAHLKRPTTAGKFSDDELAALLSTMSATATESGSHTEKIPPVVASTVKAVEYLKGCPQCESKVYHTEHSK